MARARLSTLLTASVLMLQMTVVAGIAAPVKPLRIGYLNHPGSALLLTATAKKFFKSEGVQVRLVRYHDTESGLTDLATGRIDVGAFAVGETLRQIAGGKEVRIIGGGGTALTAEVLADPDEAAKAEQESGGIVMIVAEGPRAPGKAVLIGLMTALIRAHQSLQKAPEAVRDRVVTQISLPVPDRSMHFDPSADYRRMERLWRSLGLQKEGRPRDFLANHLYEEIYCDALDRLVDRDGLKDEVLKKLFSEAVCVPDCCPKDAKKQNMREGGLL